MVSKYPVVSPQDLIKVLCKLGFKKVPQKGSRVKYTKAGCP